MAEEPEEGFTVRDRRRFMSDAPPEDKTSGPVEIITEAPTATDELSFEENAGIGEADESALPDVYSVLALFLGELRNLAWLRMGLVANPATGEIERDLPQARVAIDTAAFLADKLKNVVAPEERVPLQSLISDLQVNFVEQTKRNP